MNFKSIIKEIEQADPKVFEQLSTRRGAIKSLGSKAALAALPLAISSLFNKAYGQTSANSTVITALNVILEMEYFEYNFYKTANSVDVGTGIFIPLADAPGFTTIEAHQKEHILLLNSMITSIGGTPFTPNHYSATALPDPLFVPAAYDFTANATYNTFSDYATFLTLAQVFEDTAVHAYKGQIANLLSNIGAVTQVFQMQSAEGRHAAHVRLIRRNLNTADNPAPWITNSIPPPPTSPSQPVSQFQPFYVDENNVVQYSSINISTLSDPQNSAGTVPVISATAAFDEGYTSAQITSLLQPFLLS